MTRNSQRHLLRAVLGMDAMPTTILLDVFTQQFVCFGIQDSNSLMIRLYLDESTDPSWRYAVQSRFYFDAAVHVNDAFAVLVITEGFKRQWLKARFLFGEHRSDLPTSKDTALT